MTAMRAEWEAILDVLRDTAERVVFEEPRVDSDLARAEGVRYLLRLLAAAAMLEVEGSDPAYPQFVRLESPWMQFGLPNPDTSYLYAAVHGDHGYRIWGRRGSAVIFSVEAWDGSFAHLATSTVVGDRYEFETGPDDEIEIVLSQDEQKGNWIRLPEGKGYLVVRQYFYDWEREEPASLSIEREGAEFPPPPLEAAYLAERMALLVDFVRGISTLSARAVDQYFAPEPTAVPFPPMSMAVEGRDNYDDQIGFQGILYGQGHYRCGPDEAVILEVAPPECPYWNFQLGTVFWDSLDWTVRQTAINGHEAVLDDDGVFRAVIAHRDPGVPNWLDTGGRTAGVVSGRYYRSASAPVPSLQTVAFEDVRALLPETTPVVTPTERSEWLRRRMLSVRRRQCD